MLSERIPRPPTQSGSAVSFNLHWGKRAISIGCGEELFFHFGPHYDVRIESEAVY